MFDELIQSCDCRHSRQPSINCSVKEKHPLPMLHGIGFFIRSLRDAEFPAPQELVVEDSRLLAVADYLDQGLVFEHYRGFSWCRVCRCDSGDMGSKDLTDGVWLWPEGLSHYLRRHSVGLPEDFIGHALAQSSLSLPDSAEVTDYTRWIEWSRPRRSSSLRESISRAQAEDDKLAAIARNECVARNVEKFGVGDRTCIRAGCGEFALNGVVFCGLHLPEMSSDDSFRTQSHRLLIEALQNSRTQEAE